MNIWKSLHWGDKILQEKKPYWKSFFKKKKKKKKNVKTDFKALARFASSYLTVLKFISFIVSRNIAWTGFKLSNMA